jgi:hypothetical protein
MYLDLVERMLVFWRWIQWPRLMQHLPDYTVQHSRKQPSSNFLFETLGKISEIHHCHLKVSVESSLQPFPLKSIIALTDILFFHKRPFSMMFSNHNLCILFISPWAVQIDANENVSLIQPISHLVESVWHLHCIKLAWYPIISRQWQYFKPCIFHLTGLDYIIMSFEG